MHGDLSQKLPEQPPWAARLVRRSRPKTGWGVFLLGLGAVILLPSALVDGSLAPGLDRTVLLSPVAYLFGWWIAQRRVSGPVAATLIGLSGVIADLWWGVFVLHPGALAPQLFHWLAWASGDRQGMAPSIAFFREQGAALANYFERVSGWIRGLVVGPGVPDNLVVIGLVTLLVWLIAGWAAWWVSGARGQAFVAVLPTGVFLAQTAYWVPRTLGFVLLFLGMTAFLLVLARLAFDMRGWDEAGVDYAEDIRVDSMFTALALTLAVTFLSPALPSLASGEFSRKFWSLFESPWRSVEQRVSASFQSVEQVRSLVPATGAAPGGLPRAHLLGGRPELGEEVALRVSVRGDPTGLLLYWRGQTYATYTGRGWENQAEWSFGASLDAGEPWQTSMPSEIDRRPIVASVDVVAASRNVFYAAPEPVAVDRPYRVLLRGTDDLVALSSERGADRYTVVSTVPHAAATALRAAGSDYPSGVLTHHLQLPPHLDPRLAALAAEWTQRALTPYDKAVAIEGELRRIAYSLDVPLPPQQRELVSWFLFDLKRGYCDYSASAMIVLSRLSGIPARLAIGYATGDFDETTGQYVVTEQHAHSWPELYFPGAGWLPFEPTSGLPPVARASGESPPIMPPGMVQGPRDLTASMALIQEQARENAALERRQEAGRAVTTAVLAMSVVWAAWLTLISQRPVPGSAAPAVQAYGRLATWGRRMGRPMVRGETSREYASALGRQAGAIAARAHWRKLQAERAASVVGTEASRLNEAAESSLYAATGEPVRPSEWRSALRAALRELWIAHSFGRWARGDRP